MAIIEASHEIACALDTYESLFSDGKEIVKPCLQKFVRYLGDENTERQVDESALSKQTVTRHPEELSQDALNNRQSCPLRVLTSL